MKKLGSIILIALAAMPLAAQTAKEKDERIVAVINGEKLTAEKFEHLWEAIGPEMQKNYELTGGGKIGFLDNYIERRLILQEALKENFDKRDDVAFDLENARDTAMFNLYVSKVIAADVIPESDLRAYYDANQREFQQPESRKARHIVATPFPQPVWNTANDDARTPEEARKKLEGLRSQLTGDVTQFSDLATKFSEDMSARSGGDLGWVARGTMDDAFDEALFALAPGEVSDVIQTDFGLHIVLCEQARPAGVRPFEEVKEEIARKLAKEKQADIITALRSMTRDLREASSISIFRENL